MIFGWWLPQNNSTGVFEQKKHLTYTVLGVKISHRHDYTSCATLRHFEVEFWGGTCRYGTQVRCSVQRFIVKAAHFGARMLKVRPTREGGTPKRLKIWLFQGAFSFGFFHWWKGLKLSWNNPNPSAHHFHWVSLPSTMCYHAKCPLSGPKVARFCEGVEKAQQGGYLTSKQNASPTVSNSCPHLDNSDEAIWSAKLWTAFSRLCWGKLERSGYGVPSLTTAESDEVCFLSLLPRTIWTVFSRYCWGWSGLDCILTIQI